MDERIVSFEGGSFPLVQRIHEYITNMETALADLQKSDPNAIHDISASGLRDDINNAKEALEQESMPNAILTIRILDLAFQKYSLNDPKLAQAGDILHAKLLDILVASKHLRFPEEEAAMFPHGLDYTPAPERLLNLATEAVDISASIRGGDLSAECHARIIAQLSTALTTLQRVRPPGVENRTLDNETLEKSL